MLKTKRVSATKALEWLKSQSPRKRYEYLNRGTCLWAQFFGCTPENKREVNPVCIHDKGRETLLPLWMDHIAVMRPWTFGAATKRLDHYIKTGKTWRD